MADLFDEWARQQAKQQLRGIMRAADIHRATWGDTDTWPARFAAVAVECMFGCAPGEQPTPTAAEQRQMARAANSAVQRQRAQRNAAHAATREQRAEQRREARRTARETLPMGAVTAPVTASAAPPTFTVRPTGRAPGKVAPPLPPCDPRPRRRRVVCYVGKGPPQGVALPDPPAPHSAGPQRRLTPQETAQYRADQQRAQSPQRATRSGRRK